MDFRGVRSLPGLTLALTGGRDDIAPPDILRRLIPQWNPAARLQILPEADHFFFEHMPALAAALTAALTASVGVSNH
jgi:pimeloyl-ACP methyl ester carboxylesterase